MPIDFRLLARRLACRSELHLLALYAAVAVLTRLVLWRVEIINVDEASYMVGARELLAGRLPYVAFGDNKPPLIYAYYALANVVTGPSIGGVRLLTVLVVLPLTAFAVSAFYGHERRGIVAALLWIVYGACYTASDMLAVNCEAVMMLPLAWALVAIRTPDRAVQPGRAFVAGTLIGIASLVKYQAGFWSVAVVAAMAFGVTVPWRACVRAISALVVGIVTPLALAVAVFALVGALDDFWYWNVQHNLEYLQNPTTLSQVVLLGAKRLLPFIGVTAILWFGWVRSWRDAAPDYNQILLAALIGMSGAAALAGFRFFPHYFVQMYVPLALAAAPWAATALTLPLSTAGVLVAGYSGLLLCGWTWWNAAVVRQQVVPNLTTTPVQVSNRIRADACYEGASLFVWGSAPEFYYQAQLPLASSYFFPEYPLVRYYAGNAEATAQRRHPRRRTKRVRHWSRLMRDLRRARPTYILDTAPAGIARWQYFPTSDYPMLHHLLERHYSRLDTVGGVAVYRRNDCGNRLFAAE